MRRSRDVTKGVTDGPELDHTWPRLDRPGAQLRARKVHGDETTAPQHRTGVPHVVGHGPPCSWVIMRAVDTGEIHAALAPIREPDQGSSPPRRAG